MANETTKVSVSKDKKFLVIEIPLQKPTPSSSGKTLLVASTYGPFKSDLKIDNKMVTLSLNAYIKND